jgi:hypothetical protein
LKIPKPQRDNQKLNIKDEWQYNVLKKTKVLRKGKRTVFVPLVTPVLLLSLQTMVISWRRDSVTANYYIICQYVWKCIKILTNERQFLQNKKRKLIFYIVPKWGLITYAYCFCIKLSKHKLSASHIIYIVKKRQQSTRRREHLFNP